MTELQKRLMKRVIQKKKCFIVNKQIPKKPIKTRQSEFMKMFPNVGIYKGVITICPCLIDCNYERKHCKNYADFDCTDCKKDYWLAAVK